MTLLNNAEAIFLGTEAADSIHAGPMAVWQAWQPLRGPDGALPLQQSGWAEGRYWFNGQSLDSVTDYLAAANGDFQRASPACWFDRDGILQIADADALRLDHDPATGTPLGFRAEGERVNLWRTEPDAEALFTQHIEVRGMALRQFSGDGTTLPSWSDGNGRWVEGEIPAASILALRGTEQHIMFGLTGSSTHTHSNGAFDLDAGNYPFKGSLYRFGQQALGGGLWRLLLSANHSAPSAVLRGMRVRPSDGTSNQTRVLADQATLVWGMPQVETGTGPGWCFPSSLIPGHDGERTRAADALSWPLMLPACGTLSIEARTAPGAQGEQVLLQWDDGTEAERMRIFRAADGSMHAMLTAAGQELVDLSAGWAADDEDILFELSWGEGQASARLAGGEAVSGNVPGLPAASILREGGDSTGNCWFGTIARMVRYEAAYLQE